MKWDVQRKGWSGVIREQGCQRTRIQEYSPSQSLVAVRRYDRQEVCEEEKQCLVAKRNSVCYETDITGRNGEYLFESWQIDLI